MKIVVVESPAKAKTINKYLGPDYEVLASFGHVRDLPAKDGSVDPEHDFKMLWEVDDKSQKRLNDIARAVKGADGLILATDPDREGEAISWHVQEVLKQRRALNGVDVKRVVFNEVTKSAVQEAFRHPREVNRELVDARRIGLLRSHAYVINTSRAEIMDEGALIDALEESRIAGAGLDVYAHEPAVDPRLLALSNVVLLPHMGSATIEGRHATGARVIANIRTWVDGHRPPNQVLEGWV